MPNETKVYRGTPKTLEASGASIANNAVVQADDATYDADADGAGYPDAEFYLTGSFSVAATEGSGLMLMARPLNIDGTGDAQTPELARPGTLIGSFVVDNVTTTQYMPLQGGFARDVPLLAEYWVGNNNTGQTLASGWKLVVVPRTRGPV